MNQNKPPKSVDIRKLAITLLKLEDNNIIGMSIDELIKLIKNKKIFLKFL